MTSRTNPNLASIAAAAGVSVPTVSKVMNNRDGVSEATRERVLALIAETGYRSPQGRSRTAATRTVIDLVIGEIGGIAAGYSAGVLGGVLTFAQQHDIDVVVSAIDPTRLSLSDADEWADRMVSSGRQGLLAVTSDLTPVQHAAFSARSLPVVVVDPLNTPAADLPSVGATNWAGGRTATEHLLELGHTRIAYLGGPSNAECSQARMHGYLAALSAAGVSPRPEYIRSGGRFDQAVGLTGAHDVLSLPEPPTAIFAGSDSIALGVLEEARLRGLEIPRDLSVVGFDGIPVVEQTLPRLTSVAQPLNDIGGMALRTLLQLIAGDAPASPHLELATELVVRASTAPPRD